MVIPIPTVSGAWGGQVTFAWVALKKNYVFRNILDFETIKNSIHKARRGTGLLDNRPSTNQSQHFLPKNKQAKNGGG